MNKTALLLGLLLSPCLALASNHGSSMLTVDEKIMLSTPGFANNHPDYQLRRDGLIAYERGRFDEAMTALRRSARYADKASQALIAQMLWQGDGVAIDRSAAYAWMDLAAERGYPMMLGKREQYWNALTESERARAIDVGQVLYAEFGDEVAKPRLERELRKGLLTKTGTRVGADIDVKVFTTMPDRFGGGMDIAGFYDQKYWKPAHYWRWQDELHSGEPRGKVFIREITHQGRYRLASPDAND